MVSQDCFECGDEVTLAEWDDAGKSGAAVVICKSCRAETPEDVLWDVSNIEDEFQHKPVLVEDGDVWTVKSYTNDVRSYKMLKESWDGVVLDGYSNVPNRELVEIFVHSAEDRESVEAAREFIREEL